MAYIAAVALYHSKCYLETGSVPYRVITDECDLHAALVRPNEDLLVLPL